MVCLFSVRFWGGIFLLVGGVAAGCDSAPGPAAVGFPPELSEFSYTPQQVVLEEWPSEEVVDGRVHISLSVAVTAEDPEGAVVEVGYVVESPLRGVSPVAAGPLAPAGAGRYEAVIPVEIPVGDVGPYTVRLYAVDAAGLLSNQVRGTLRFTAQGEAPVIEEVAVPASVARPAEGESPLVVAVVAVVSDPDGLRNVSRVLFWEAARPEAVFPLRDDGAVRQSGDVQAGDGRYTAFFGVDARSTPGERTFVFQAYDRAGQASAVVEQVVRIE